MQWKMKEKTSGNALVAINSFMYYLNTYIRASKRGTHANIQTYIYVCTYIIHTNFIKYPQGLSI